MPILDVEVVVRPGEALPLPLAKALADAMGEVFGSRPGGLWLRLRELPAARYAENGGEGEAPCPVFVTVREARVPERAVLEPRMKDIAGRVAALTGRPRENVHVIQEPPLAGRIAFGGEFVP